MAGDWIKMRIDLAGDPAVISVAAALGFPDEDTVVGKLHRIWAWASLQLTDGNAHGVTKMFIDRLVSVTGFADALEKAGWLEVHEWGIVIPKWDNHNSKSAKKRALGADRAEEHRNAHCVTKVLQKRYQRREEKMMTPPTPQGAAGGGHPSPEKSPDTLTTDWGFSQVEAETIRRVPGITAEDEALWRAHLVQVRETKRVIDPLAYVKTQMRAHRSPEAAGGSLARSVVVTDSDVERPSLEAVVRKLAASTGEGNRITDGRGVAWEVTKFGLYGPKGFQTVTSLTLADLQSLAHVTGVYA
jgi:hypothetical protein